MKKMKNFFSPILTVSYACKVRETSPFGAKKTDYNSKTDKSFFNGHGVKIILTEKDYVRVTATAYGCRSK